MKLYKHQERALELLAERESFALFMEQGTGKTIPALIHVTNLLIAGDIDDCLIVAPLSTLGSWKRDLEKLSPMRQRLASKITLIKTIHRKIASGCHLKSKGEIGEQTTCLLI